MGGKVETGGWYSSLCREETGVKHWGGKCPKKGGGRCLLQSGVWADVWVVCVVCVVQMTCCTCFTTIFDVKQVLQGEERYDTLISLRKHKCVEISASVGDLILHFGTAQFN